MIVKHRIVDPTELNEDTAAGEIWDICQLFSIPLELAGECKLIMTGSSFGDGYTWYRELKAAVDAQINIIYYDSGIYKDFVSRVFVFEANLLVPPFKKKCLEVEVEKCDEKESHQREHANDQSKDEKWNLQGDEMKDKENEESFVGEGKHGDDYGNVCLQVDEKIPLLMLKAQVMASVKEKYDEKTSLPEEKEVEAISCLSTPVVEDKCPLVQSEESKW